MFFRESNPKRFRPNFGIYEVEQNFVVPNQSGIYCLGVLPVRPIKIIEVPNQSGIYCLGVLPVRPIKIIEVPNQSGIYCQQNIIR